MRKEIKNLAASVKARLFNKAKAEGRTFNEVLQYFAMERFLYRLSISPHADRFILKGALMLQVWGGPEARATRDIDLLGRKPASTEECAAMMRDSIDAQVPDDGFRFDAKSVVAEEIRTGERYEGVRVRFEGHLASARVQVQVDIGFGDRVTPAPVRVEYPAMLEFPGPRLFGYTPETTIAEKFCAMVTRDMENSRIKDFYDLWFLAGNRAFRASTIAKAIKTTFSLRGLAIPKEVPTALTAAFGDHPMKKTQWTAFLRKSRLVAKLSLNHAILVIAGFLSRPIDIARDPAMSDATWPPGGPWSRA